MDLKDSALTDNDIEIGSPIAIPVRLGNGVKAAVYVAKMFSHQSVAVKRRSDNIRLQSFALQN
jgi:hypothetical protein